MFSLVFFIHAVLFFMFDGLMLSRELMKMVICEDNGLHAACKLSQTGAYTDYKASVVFFFLIILPLGKLALVFCTVSEKRRLFFKLLLTVLIAFSIGYTAHQNWLYILHKSDRPISVCFALYYIAICSLAVYTLYRKPLLKESPENDPLQTTVL